ncbi:hypothetical protein AVEN_135532-1 [Araneus ventricosus]|uniref:Uncharacterized protein n=1 Tax=Araneus ventricosus TaxID=182803 RepID=A0A4Y2HE93_ARAVE|nr:hypothetical protein AVEN_135532-1 [Araneus ventricosus]
MQETNANWCRPKEKLGFHPIWIFFCALGHKAEIRQSVRGTELLSQKRKQQNGEGECWWESFWVNQGGRTRFEIGRGGGGSVDAASHPL